MGQKSDVGLQGLAQGVRSVAAAHLGWMGPHYTKCQAKVQNCAYKERIDDTEMNLTHLTIWVEGRSNTPSIC